MYIHIGIQITSSVFNADALMFRFFVAIKSIYNSSALSMHCNNNNIKLSTLLAAKNESESASKRARVINAASITLYISYMLILETTLWNSLDICLVFSRTRNANTCK